MKDLQTQQQHMKKTLFLAILGASAMSASAIPINSGNINTLDPTATSYGAVRFKDFTNTKDGRSGQAAGNLYLQDNAGYLGTGTGLDGRARVQSPDAATGPVWHAGDQPFTFEYRPVAGGTDLIFASAVDNTTFQRVINDPAKPVNFISFYILNQVAGSGAVTLNLTDLDGKALTPSALTISAVSQDKWYLTDPTLLANGFILSGSINLGDPRNAGEIDKIDIAFGNANVPDGGTTLVLLGGALTGLGALRRKFRA